MERAWSLSKKKGRKGRKAEGTQDELAWKTILAAFEHNDEKYVEGLEVDLRRVETLSREKSPPKWPNRLGTDVVMERGGRMIQWTDEMSSDIKENLILKLISE